MIPTLVKQLIVIWLEKLCTALDGIPTYDRQERKWYRHGNWGCHPLGLALLSSHLDEKWDTKVWKLGARLTD